MIEIHRARRGRWADRKTVYASNTNVGHSVRVRNLEKVLEK